jgi:hypothetical protein
VGRKSPENMKSYNMRKRRPSKPRGKGAGGFLVKGGFLVNNDKKRRISWFTGPGNPLFLVIFKNSKK